MTLPLTPATFWATLHLALGTMTRSVSGTPAQARGAALAYGASLGWHPSAVQLTPTGPRARVVLWYGFDGQTWRSGGWCPGCARWVPRRGPMHESALCACGDALWLSPLDPGEACPGFYSRAWSKSP